MHLIKIAFGNEDLTNGKIHLSPSVLIAKG